MHVYGAEAIVLEYKLHEKLTKFIQVISLRKIPTFEVYYMAQYIYIYKRKLSNIESSELTVQN